MTGPKKMRVLANAQQLVDELAEQGPLSPAELAQAIDVPRPSVYRLVAGLESIELVSTLADGRVTLGRRWLHLADASRDGMREWARADEMLEQLAGETGQTAFLCTPRKHAAVCIAWAQGRGIDILTLRPGRALPYHAGAAGRALLAFADEDDVDAYLADAPFPRLTPATLTDAPQLRDDISATRANGFVLSDEDVTVGIAAVGAPVFSASGSLVGAVSVGGLADEIRANVPRLSQLLQAAARDIVATA